MGLPAPNLDDRRFQDIVDEAKRRITRHCPEWTDHNVSDPGVAMVELFAWMTEMLLYRLNQVPDRLYIKFLELVGIELFSAVPARASLLFTLAAPRDEPVRVPAGTQVSTERGDQDPIVFLTDHDLNIVPPRLVACLTESGGQFTDHSDDFRLALSPIELFPTLRADDAVYFGFAEPAAANLLRLDVATGPEGAGVDPRRPPRVWEAYDGQDWRPVRVLEDTSAGFNSAGRVTLLLPPRHENLVLGTRRAFWLRCRLVRPAPGQPEYRKPPQLERLTAVALGGAASALHAEPAPAEVLGTSTGQPGQMFQVRRAPVLPRRPDETVKVIPPRADRAREPEEQVWTEVADLADATADDRVFTWSGASGEIRFGPRVYDRQGKAWQHGAVPPVDAQVVVTGYRFGGGRRGNLAAGRLTVLRTSIPFVASVTNLDPATGGVDPETVENAKLRGPLLLRQARRAVTAEDVERLALDAAPAVVRARCLPPAAPGEPARLLIVPRVDIPPDSLELDDLKVPADIEEQLKAYLEPRRLLTMRLRIEPPKYQGVKVVAEVRAGPGVRPETVRERAEQALYAYLNPLTGGPGGDGWPFGVDLRIGDVYGVLHGSFGVQGVEGLAFFPVDLRRRETLEQADQRLRLVPEALFMSFQHRVVVRQ